MLVDPSQSSHNLHMLSLTNSHGVGGGTCLSVISCPCCGVCLLCIRVRCIHGTVQVSSFYFQPKGEGKARLHAASIVFITAGRGIVYINHVLMRFLDEMNSLAVGCSDR